MDEKLNPASSPRESSLVDKFRDKPYRDSYVASHTRRFLARQMRKFRGEKSQAEFGEMIDKRQTVVSRLEDSKYGKWTLQTLFEVASKLDVAVIVRFVDFSTFLRLTNDMSDEASRPEAYDPNTIESFSTVNLASPFGGPGALPINVPNWPNPSLGGGILGGQMMWGNPSELYWQQLLPRREQNTQSITKRPVEDLINSIRQQNPIADTKHIGVH